MFQNNSRYQLALIFAVIFHVILLFFILFKMNFSSQLPSAPQNNVNIVQAVAISSTQVQQQVKELKQQQDAKQQAEQEKLAKIKQAAQKAKEQVQQEQQKIAKLKAQQQAVQQQKVAAQKLQQQKAVADAQAKKVAQQKAVADAQAKKIAQQKALQQKKDADDLMQQQLDQEQAQLNANKTQAINSAVNKYAALITSAISQHWLIPEGVDKNSSCTLVIRLAPNGTVLDVQLSQSSGNASLDQSAIKAVYKASPLPVPADPSVFNQMRVLNLTVRPEDILNG